LSALASIRVVLELSLIEIPTVEKTISSITDSGSDRSTSVENATNDKPNEHTDRPNVDRPKTNDNKVETKKNVSFFLNNPN
jgi:hypothetical protein